MPLVTTLFIYGHNVMVCLWWWRVIFDTYLAGYPEKLNYAFDSCSLGFVAVRVEKLCCVAGKV